MPYFGIPIRNGLPIGLGSVAGFGVQQFSPADLFSAGEQGAWYDPSDLTTLFDDSAGTTPVSAPGNGADVWVGLMLDKSKGLVLGSELVTGAFVNGGALPWPSFSASGTGFTASVTGSFNIYQVANPNGISIVSGRWYRVTVNITQSTDDSVSVALQTSSTGGGTLNSTSFTFGPTTAATITGYVQATSTTTAYLQFSQQGTTITFNVASVSVRELPGNHATQTTSAKRPKLAARYNLLQRTEEFDNGYWSRGNVLAFGSGSVANATTAPDGTVTADLLTPNTSANVKYLAYRDLTGTGGAFSVFGKPNGYNFLTLYFYDSARPGSVDGATFNISTGVFSNLQNAARPVTYSVAVANNGFYKITITTSLAYTQIGIVASNTANNTSGSDNLPTFTGDGTSGIYIWGADLRPASQATGLIGPTYQRVVDAATYDTAGFLPYLAFDGLDDSMSTNSIDFTATDKMTVWAGYRISAGTGSQQLAELTANGYTTNGGFAVGQGPNAGTSGFGFLMNNGAGIAGETAAITVPYSSVISYQFDSALSGLANEAKLRRNQVAQTYASTTGTDSGTGNFANAPLYLGARLGTSVYINGWLTSLIVRGAQSTQSQIEATESWVNGKTGAY